MLFGRRSPLVQAYAAKIDPVVRDRTDAVDDDLDQSHYRYRLYKVLLSSLTVLFTLIVPHKLDHLKDVEHAKALQESSKGIYLPFSLSSHSLPSS